MSKYSHQFSIGHFAIDGGSSESGVISGSRPFIIAELSGNHSQDYDTAIAMVEAAAKSGVDAIKLQTYTADSMTLNIEAEDFVIEEADSLWKGEKLHSLYGKAATPYEWHELIFKHAQELGLVAFSSPFDEDAVDFLDDLNVPCFKIASFELTDLPLIARAASKGKPLIMSTGMASLGEIEEALDTARSNGCKDIVLLKCTSTYPASPKDTNLVTIPDLQKRFGCLVGLSDHTRGVGVSLASIPLGAKVIEKHFVLDRSLGGVDAEFSMEPQEFKLLCEESSSIFEAIGTVQYGGSEAEQKSKKYRRSIYVKKTIAKGELLTKDNIQVVRPAFGLAPKHWDEVLGNAAATDLQPGLALQWQYVER